MCLKDTVCSGGDQSMLLAHVRVWKSLTAKAGVFLPCSFMAFRTCSSGVPPYRCTNPWRARALARNPFANSGNSCYLYASFLRTCTKMHTQACAHTHSDTCATQKWHTCLRKNLSEHKYSLALPEFVCNLSASLTLKLAPLMSHAPYRSHAVSLTLTTSYQG